MQRDEADAPKAKPKTPCLVCETPTDAHPVCERFQLCIPCFAAWLADPRFHGGDLATNAARTPAWIAEAKARAA